MKKGINGVFLWALCSFNALAGSDPVAWSVFPATGFPTTKVGEQSIVYYTFTNRLPFATRLVMSSKITGSSFMVHDDCHNKVINPGKQCVVVVSFKPASTKQATFQLTYGYDKNRIPLPVLNAKGASQPQPPLNAHLSGTITGLPTTFNQNTTVDFSAVYRNTGTTTLTGCNFPTTSFSSSGVTVANLSTSAGTPVCGTTLAPGAFCRVDGLVTSGSATGILTISTTARCSGPSAVSVTPKASALIKTPSGVCVVHASLDFPLPNATYKYADNLVRFRFENECPTAVTLGPVSVTADEGTATISKAPYAAASTLNNCGATLAAGAECVVTASVIPSSVGNLIISGSVSPTGKAVASAKTSASVASNIQATHHVLFINQCKFPVWYGIANGGNANCPGQSCASKDPNLTTYANGAPASSYYLAAQVEGAIPSTIDLAVSSYTNGAIWPRTGCTMQNGQFNCATGTCQTMSNSGTCLSSPNGGPVQPQGPYTKIEGYISSTPGGDGVYDVSVINGMTVPAEMKAFGPSTGNTASTVYNCSAAGALIQPASNNALGNCSWRFNPESTMPIVGINSDFYWVTPSSLDTTCSGARCGMSFNAYPDSNGNSDVPINRHLGDFLAFNPLVNDAGYVDSTQWGSDASNLFTKYGMGIQIAGQTSTNNYGTTLVDGTSIVLTGNTYPAYNTLLDLPGISNNGSLNSCYQINNTFFAHCGGCVNWTNTLPANACGYGSPNYQSKMNLDWTTNKVNAPVGKYTPKQAIEWLKNACPTAYSYQFDDQTSSFQCNQDNKTSLLTSYQITFCPGGVDSLPAGATEGRSTAP